MSLVNYFVLIVGLTSFGYEVTATSLTFQSCPTFSKTARYVQLDATKGKWPKDGFCRTLMGRSVTGSSYGISVNLFNYQAWRPNFGHPGIFYNAKNINNFDFVYFRPHSSGGCFQTGCVKNGVLKWDGGVSSSCRNGPPPHQKWFNVKVEVRKKSVSIFKDGLLVRKTTSHFPATGKGGVLVANGYMNIIRFKGYRVQKLQSHSYSVAACASVTKTTSYVQLAATNSKWPRDGFCRTLMGKSVTGSSYAISVNLFNYQAWRPNAGHLGILFNAMDINNFDFVYFRPHSSGKCFQTGYVKNSVLKWDGAISSSCPNGPPPHQKWFRAKVEVRGKSVSIIKDGALVRMITSHFTATGKGGVLVANGYKNTIRFKDYRIVRI